MNKTKKILAALPAALVLNAGAAVSATTLPATGNTESSTYIWILIAAGVLLIAAVVAGIFTKKKK